MACIKREGQQQRDGYRGDENMRAIHGVPVHDFTGDVNARRIIANGVMLFGTKTVTRGIYNIQPTRCTQFVIYTSLIYRVFHDFRA